MSALSIRDLDERVKQRLRIRAAEHGRSMEAEIRTILSAAVSEPALETGLGQALLTRFAEVGGIRLDLPPRAAVPRAADFSS